MPKFKVKLRETESITVVSEIVDIDRERQDYLSLALGQVAVNSDDRWFRDCVEWISSQELTIEEFFVLSMSIGGVVSEGQREMMERGGFK